MTALSARGPVVIDTDVFGADLSRSRLAALYEPIIVGRNSYISFQTVAELRYGAMRRQWGPKRIREMEARIGQAETVHSGAELVITYARLRAECERMGHALAQKEHNADRWIAATAIRLGIPLVAHDRIYENVPGLQLESAHS